MSGGARSLAAIDDSPDKSLPDTPKILLTGASGFIGGHLLPLLKSSGFSVLTLARDGVGGATLDLAADSPEEAWTAALAGVDAVIHLAAIAHQASEPDLEALTAVNVHWPVRLFKAASKAGVHDFVFLSSIKVFGDRSLRPFRVEDPYAPDDNYGESKVHAEQALLAAKGENAHIRLAIVRPPLVYGPGVKANFRTLLAWAARGCRGLPLPFGAARAPRSLVSVQNLTEAVIASLGHNGIFHCADADDLPVVDLFRALGVRRWLLLPVPAGVMRLLLKWGGHEGNYQRLYESLQLDTSESTRVLGWSPRHRSDQSLAQTMNWWRQ